MTARQGLATGSAGAAVLTTNGVDKGTDRSLAFSWEDWFQHASPSQRAEALTLAQQQGLLYPDQLPPTKNGVKPAPSAKETPLSLLITSLLAGKSPLLPDLNHQPITFFDQQLDDTQRQAVLRAIHTPDLCLIKGLPGTGKSRALAEILSQCCCRGQRVLFLAAETSSLDVVLHRLVGRSEVFALRLLDAQEKAESLPAWLRGFTLEDQKQAFLERTLTGARSNRDRSEAACKERHEQTGVWTELQSCADSYQTLDYHQSQLNSRLANVTNDVSRDADDAGNTSAFSAGIRDLRQLRADTLKQIDTALAQQSDELTKCNQQSAELASQIQRLEPGYQARKNGRFWTVAYWTNLFNGAIAEDDQTLGRPRQRQRQLDHVLAECYRAMRVAARETQQHDIVLALTHAAWQCDFEREGTPAQNLRLLGEPSQELDLPLIKRENRDPHDAAVDLVLRECFQAAHQGLRFEIIDEPARRQTLP